MQLSNALGRTPVPIGAAHIAIRQKDAKVLPASDRTLTFGGRASFSIPPGALVVSDPVDLEIPKLTDLAVSIYFPNDTGPPTVHPLGLHCQLHHEREEDRADPSLKPSATTSAYFWLSSVDVVPPSRAGAIVAFGDFYYGRLRYES